MATRKVRYKKLSIKTALPVLREDQVDPSEYEALTTETQIATGVDQGEENVSSFFLIIFHHVSFLSTPVSMHFDVVAHPLNYPITCRYT